jgi:hypothetical protein
LFLLVSGWTSFRADDLTLVVSPVAVHETEVGPREGGGSLAIDAAGTGV